MSGVEARRCKPDGRRKTLLVAMALACATAVSAEIRVPAADAGPATYTDAAIVAPENDAAVRSNAGNLSVLVRVDPKLQKGHRLQLTLDGVSQEATHRDPVFELTNIDRGTHTLQLHIVDHAGEVVFTGSPSTFHLLRHSRLHP